MFEREKTTNYQQISFLVNGFPPLSRSLITTQQWTLGNGTSRGTWGTGTKSPSWWSAAFLQAEQMILLAALRAVDEQFASSVMAHF